MEQHLLHIALLAKAGFCALVRNLRLPGRLLPFFLLVVAVHWGEHVAQLAQIYLLGWPRPHAGGILGLMFPVLVKGEWLHTGFSLIMLAGLFGFRGEFRRAAYAAWLVALGIQVFHTIEHNLLFVQASAGLPPVSIVQALLPPGLRPELHLVYNGAVTAPMLLAQGLMAIGGDIRLFSAFYYWGRQHGHPIPFCIAQAWRQSRARRTWAVKSWSIDDVSRISSTLVAYWYGQAGVKEGLRHVHSFEGFIAPVDEPNALVGILGFRREGRESVPVALRMVHTRGLLDVLEGLGPEMFTAALASVTAHELSHVDQHIRRATPTDRTLQEELAADAWGVAVAEAVGFANARAATIAALERLLLLQDKGRAEVEERIRALRGTVDA